MNAALQIYENFRSAVVVHSGLRKEYEGSERAPLTRAPTFEKLQRLRGDQPSSDLSVGGDQRGFQAGPKARATSSLRNTGYTRGIYSVQVKETRVSLERLDAKLENNNPKIAETPLQKYTTVNIPQFSCSFKEQVPEHNFN